MGSLVRLNLQQDRLAWDPEMEEAAERPPSIRMIDNYFTIYQRRRRTLVSGGAPPGLGDGRPPQARTWRAYQHRMQQEPPWERAERYQQMIAHHGFRSIRALAKTTGGDHSRIAKVLKILGLPERVLTALQEHASHPCVRSHFTEKRLRQLVKQNRDESAILREIEQVIQNLV